MRCCWAKESRRGDGMGTRQCQSLSRFDRYACSLRYASKNDPHELSRSPLPTFASTRMTQHQIVIYFDIICAWVCISPRSKRRHSSWVLPWSYIGHRVSFQAIELFRKTYPGARRDEYIISWRPYYRDCSLPDVGVPLEERLESALGPDRLGNIKARVVRQGLNHGVNFVFSSHIGNTRSCHRPVYAIGLSKGSEMQRELIEQIYFRRPLARSRR